MGQITMLCLSIPMSSFLVPNHLNWKECGLSTRKCSLSWVYKFQAFWRKIQANIPRQSYSSCSQEDWCYLSLGCSREELLQLQHQHHRCGEKHHSSYCLYRCDCYQLHVHLKC